MAEVEFFHYRAGSGFLYSLNTGIKYLCALLLSVTLFHSSVLELSALTLIILPLLALALKPSPASLIKRMREMKGFLFLLLLVASIRGFSSSGPIEERWLFSGLYCWKIIMLLITGQVLIQTTDPSELHGALYRFLRKIPFVPAGPAATMLSLTIAFIPLIFDQYSEIRQAAESRLSGLNRNPFSRIFHMGLPLLETTLTRADEISAAMESRCYNHNPTLPEAALSRKDIALLLAVILSAATIFIFNY
ncbi:energy-coupling factor transporter transmembrane component T family protein [Spirochaeta isovalerica]|uniref:Energy-coupling factor transport system permease protein n=1 Tax=Spirochaeta isovalerica TaxID=150 RepID=A0A841RJ56_9SPIO|nr:energy-coupling factor transporter transmembrane component T [Spirochaeta isovalerica]MBB6482548.1 energy-coupling factor transport system permease protein [Spirochaeta isovalerica]